MKDQPLMVKMFFDVRHKEVAMSTILYELLRILKRRIDQTMTFDGSNRCIQILCKCKMSRGFSKST